MTCVDSYGNPIECNTSKENCNGLSNYYYSASDNLCKPHTTCTGQQQTLVGATGTSAGTCANNCIGLWGEWSSCDTDCGGGKKTKTYTISRYPSNGGSPCPYDNGEKDEKTCNIQPCPVDCEGSWGSWSSCDKDCGGGEKQELLL